jgi:hypothetical protein
MSQNFAADAIRQMPQVTSPYFPDMKIIGKLVANRLDQTTYAFAKPQLLWIELSSPPILCGHRKLKSLRLKKFRFEWLRKICPVTQKKAGVTIGQFPNHVNVMDVRGGKVKGLNHADRVDLHMKLKTVKGVIAELFAIVGYSLKELGALGSGESANSDGEAVKHDSGISESFGYVLEQPLLGCPQLCGLTSESNSATEVWEVMPVEPFEESEDGFVGLKAEDFTYDFHCKYFAVSQLRQWASRSNHSWFKAFFHKIISFAEDIYDKIIKVHFLPSMVNGTVTCFQVPSTRGHFLYQYCAKNLYTALIG